MQNTWITADSKLALQYVLVTVDSGKPVMFAGTEEPAAFGELFSIGAIGGDKNKQVIPALCTV